MVLSVLPGSAAAVCVGDCNNNGSVTASELTKVISIINLCDGNAAGCAAVPGSDKQCTNADRNGNGVISAAELTLIIQNINTYESGCAPSSNTPTATPTATLALPTATPTLELPTATPTTGTGPPLGLRTFSLGASSAFYTSLVTGSQGTPMGTLLLNAGGLDGSGKTTVTLSGAPTIIHTDLPLGGLTLCTKIESCTGTLYCNPGTNVDVLNTLDSLKAGATCVRDGTHACSPPPSPTPAVCCSNACEGVGVGSGNDPVEMSGVGTKDSGAGAMVLICMQRTATVMPIGDCAKADFTSAKLTPQYYTTGIDTTQVINHCAGSGSPANRIPKLAKVGTPFDCTNWTVENGAGVLAFTIPAEEGSSAITGDGANAGLWSDK